MIKCMKGLFLTERNMRSTYPESCVITTSFKFRDKRLDIHNVAPWDIQPFIGCEFNKEQIQQLINWLEECLLEKKCDECWNLKIPEILVLNGTLACSKCGEFYK